MRTQLWFHSKIRERGIENRVKVVTYEQLVGESETTLRELEKFLDHQRGPKTPEILEDLQFTELPYPPDQILDKCEENIRSDFSDIVEEINQSFGSSYEREMD